MNVTLTMRLICAAGALAVSMNSYAESVASSASSAGSASSGSVSDSFAGSSNSSNNHKRVADADYRIIQIAATPGRADRTRVTMQADDPEQRIVLDLPQVTFDKQQLAVGDAMYAHNRVYGIEFGRTDNRQPFYLVLADEWYGELASRPLSL
ncbi:hypothetical protein SAMN05192549_11579 [Duganella sacchari]|jgi:hypothetical protein|uniref:Uncharacterized protein n=1 Tax=Duganella sacchari TaxID=551987 RepID=A0A1M7R991_9BURK|nr:hypothetical protein [Duganella sacchari]SHN42884.1 hypothetical protein SAMN05192549_11579 [Duganella sacchari]